MIELLRRFEAVLPAVRDWIARTVAAHEDAATPISALRFASLARHFPASLLERARSIAVPRVPVPPLTQMGLPELVDFERMAAAGITYGDTVFVLASEATESLHFHELVHVVQWDALGPDNFLRAYGVGLAQDGYRDSPLERIAYDLQHGFDHRHVPHDVVSAIADDAARWWTEVEPLLRQAGIPVTG